MNRPASRRPLLLVLLAAPAVTLFFLTGQERDVATPAVVAVVIALVFVVGLLNKSPVLPLDEIGVWYVAAITMYAVLPLLVFLALGLTYTPLNDMRLFNYQPTPNQVGEIGWYCVGYLISFTAVYTVMRGGSVATPPLPPIDRATVVVAVALLLSANAFFIVVGVLYDLSATTYWEGYLAVQRLPLLLRQTYRLVSGVRLVFSLVLFVWLFQNYRRMRWIIALWLLYEFWQAVSHAGERTTFIMLTTAALILYHRFVRPLSLWAAVSAGVLALGLFMALGVYRAFRNIEDQTAFAVGVNAGEFESLFANALDIQERKRSNELKVPVGFYFSDIAAVMPSQILPFEKVDAADWYVGTFYPEARDRGEGYALGVVAQSIIGIGWVELILRGALVGYILGRLHRYYRRRGSRLWVLVGYVWMILWAYESFRATTFYVFSMFVQHLLFAIVLLEIGRVVLLRAAAIRGRST